MLFYPFIVKVRLFMLFTKLVSKARVLLIVNGVWLIMGKELFSIFVLEYIMLLKLGIKFVIFLDATKFIKLDMFTEMLLDDPVDMRGNEKLAVVLYLEHAQLTCRTRIVMKYLEMVQYSLPEYPLGF
jgi:hypothetical protein